MLFRSDRKSTRLNSKQKTAYEMCPCDLSSDVCSSDLLSLGIPIELKCRPLMWQCITPYAKAEPLMQPWTITKVMHRGPPKYFRRLVVSSSQSATMIPSRGLHLSKSAIGTGRKCLEELSHRSVRQSSLQPPHNSTVSNSLIVLYLHSIPCLPDRKKCACAQRRQTIDEDYLSVTISSI